MDRKEIEGLYRRYGSAVLRRARVLLGDETAAQDAAHEVFVRAIQSGDSFRGDASPMTWLYRMTTNYCLNVIRNRSRRQALRHKHVNDLPLPSAPPMSAESLTAAEQLLSRIPEDLREIAVYYYVDRMNHHEIAEMIGVSRRTIGNRLDAFRAVAQQLVESASGEPT